ncbi:MAG: right-handed parallel beta-helix repeat-containing protein [Actinobacteria bacterium]|nr:right-handed parallel beta-helix repeat-containing protein [Actinomycetota bacterium]
MRTTTWRRLSAALAFTAVATLAVGCGSSDSDGAKDTGSGGGDESSLEAIRVPQDHRTIQEAVDAAKSGDLILIDEGTYKEAVDVTTPDITLRGVDRNKVILDGGFKLENGVRILDTDGVVVENMTARNYLSNGFYWTGSDRYRGSYLTAYRNGDYGIYAFDAYHGQFDHSLGSGSPDAGFYIGECYKCDAVIDDVVSEHNGLGYSGTNSGGDLYIINSTFRYNRAGIVPNAGSYELCYPGRRNTIVGNTVYDNNNNDAPAIDVALLAQGNGILVAGSVDNVVERNLVFKHDRTGIAAVPFPEEDANDRAPDKSEWDTPCDETRDQEIPAEDADPGLVLWHPFDNSFVGNVVEDSGVADLASATLEGDGITVEGLGNCFSDNTFTSSAPEDIETLAPCEGTGSGDWSKGALDLVPLIAEQAPKPPKDTYTKTPVPEDQESMPDALTKPAAKFEGPEKPDVDGIEVPKKPAA